MQIEEIQAICDDAHIEITGHMLLRIQQRNIAYKEIKEVLKSGEIVEDYPNDYPYPSCLVMGKTVCQRVLHVVVGLGEGKLWLITAYEPDFQKWKSGFSERMV